MHVNLSFPVRGQYLPGEHHYLLYAALSHAIASFHRPGEAIRFTTINGLRGPSGLIQVFPKSQLRLRLPQENIGEVLPLAGLTLQVGDHTIHLGVPTVTPLSLATALAARIVTFKHSMDPERFLATARQRLTELDIQAQPEIPLLESGKRIGEPRRQVLRIHGRPVVGFALRVTGLSAEESLRLQEEGLGGRRRLGCGFFTPWRPKPT